jgi:hypothetical protein
LIYPFSIFTAEFIHHDQIPDWPAEIHRHDAGFAVGFDIDRYFLVLPDGPGI